MICKYCSSEIDPGSNVCPKCGKPGNKTAGGNGFWDIARGPSYEPSPAVPRVEESIDITPKYAVSIVICAIVCIISLILSILTILSDRRESRNLYDSFDNQLSEQDKLYTREKEALESEIEAMRQKISQLESSSEADIEMLRIHSSSMSETADVGFQNQPGSSLFHLKVDGAVDSFRWEKHLDNGVWDDIIFDSNMNEQYGLRLEEDLSQGTTQLVADGLTQESFGTYKCTAVAENGTEQSVIMQLINTPSDTEEESEDGMDIESENESLFDDESESYGGWWPDDE